MLSKEKLKELETALREAHALVAQLRCLEDSVAARRRIRAEDLIALAHEAIFVALKSEE